eukprot:TRINITY_DN580_c0_g1_i1.p2 TRINITY_DN580_c0_g1~~TRINITY_DN580_c0_g1_i1.p2  ORF type:complete len:103 (-),score=15.51 TRINITY_DN580_c0_g1_i1:265-573(-)
MHPVTRNYLIMNGIKAHQIEPELFSACQECSCPTLRSEDFCSGPCRFKYALRFSFSQRQKVCDAFGHHHEKDAIVLLESPLDSPTTGIQNAMESNSASMCAC